MRQKIFFCAIFILVGLLPNTRADVTDWFVVLDATNGFYASPGIHEPAIAALQEAQSENVEIKSFAFTPTGDWLLLNDKGFKSSDDSLRICQMLHKSDQHFQEINCFIINPSGHAGAISYQDGRRWGEGDGPSAAWNKLGDLPHDGHKIRSISYGAHDSWVILYDDAGISYGGVPVDLAKVLDNAVSNNIPVRCVAFSGRDWICLADDNWWTSNPDLPASKFIDQSFKSGRHPKWIAFVPNNGTFNARKFGAIIRQTLDGKLAGGYACEVIDHGKVVVSLAEGWARAPWEPKDPSIPWTINTRQEVASVSKTITAAAILKLWEECSGTSQQFSLDEPFWPHISEIYPNVNEDVKKITIRQLLQHTSGFVNNENNPAKVGSLLLLPLAYPPGTVSNYKNVNFYILRLVIEQISRQNYADYVKTHVLAPMGIQNVELHGEEHQPICYYAKSDDRGSGEAGYDDCSNHAGPNGWHASAADLGKFLEGLRQCTVLRPATTTMM
jgi:hypothetical protein